MSADPYWKLRPASPTPPDEICQCSPIAEVMLRAALSSNPLTCVACVGEIPPERIDLPPDLADEIAGWCSVYTALYLLWLDSGEYESWAAKRLRDPAGEVNVGGRRLVTELARLVPAYYWWFRDEGHLLSAEECPVCRGALSRYANRNFQACHSCRIFI